MTRIDLCNKYNYYDQIACKRNLIPAEKNFLNFCVDNHNAICQESTPEEIMKDIVFEAEKLEDMIYEAKESYAKLREELFGKC